MENGWTMGGGGAGRVWTTYEAKPGNLGLCWNKKNSCREQNPLVESEGSGRAAGEAAPWCQRGFGWGRGGGDATAAGTRLSRLRGSRCAPSAQRCPRAGQSRSRHIPRELLLGPPGSRSLGWGGTGGRRQVRDCPRSWLRSAGAVGGCSRGPRAHAQNPFGLFGQETGAANLISRVLQGPPSCSASWRQLRAGAPARTAVGMWHPQR